MKIQFKNHWDEVEEYPIFSINYSMDAKGPIDIFITSYEEVLKEIGERHGSIGCIKETDNLYAAKYGATHEALYARLPPFKVVGEDMSVSMQCIRPYIMRETQSTPEPWEDVELF